VRVLMIAPTSFFSDYGGHIRILEEIRALGEIGVEVAVVTYYKGNNVPGIDIRRTAPLPWHTDYEVGSSRHKIAFDIYLAAQSLKEVRRFRPDIIHGHMHEGALIGGMLARLTNVPLVFDYQGSLTAEMIDHHFLNPRGSIYPWAYQVESIITRRLPDAILASSGQAIALLRDDFRVPPQRIHALSDCADALQFDPTRFPFASAEHPLRHALGIPDGTTVIGYLGLLTDYQGIPHLIESAVEMRRRGENVHFLVMGYPNVEHYQAIARLRGVEEIVTFTGRIPFSDAPYYLAACDIAVAPKMSTSEGSGKLLNYMAMARPIVAYDTPVNREYLDDLGVYAPPGDVGAFTDALAGLSRDPGCRTELGARLRRRVIEHFSWAAAAEKILNIYRSIDKRGKLI
jgi:glycosyltransferase involved in cell wall biosynthesis